MEKVENAPARSGIAQMSKGWLQEIKFCSLGYPFQLEGIIESSPTVKRVVTAIAG